MPDCKTCGSPDIADINKAIAEGIGANTIAARYNVPLTSVKRHRENEHHTRQFRRLAKLTPKDRALAIGEQAAATAEGLIAKSVDLMDRAELFLDRAEAASDANAMARAFGVMERCIRLVSELAGAFPKKDGPSIDARSVTINALNGLSTDELKALIASQQTNDG